MRKLGIIQPGKIGDIVICLPIAKWYADRGYEVIWPVDASIIDNFIEYIDYVKFVPTQFNCDLARQICRSHDCNTVIDLSFTLPGQNNHNTEVYLNQKELSFDQMKYHIANVPFEEKWNIQFNRHIEREAALYNKLVKESGFVVVQWSGSDCRREAKFDNPHNYQIIEVKPLTKSIFDWVSILKKARYLVLIDSSIANLCDQIGLSQKKYLLTRSWARPKFKQNWIVID